MASSSQPSDIFDPRIAYPAATDAVLHGLRASFNEHIDWLDGYLQQVKEADVLRTKSSNLPSSKSSAQSDGGGLWVNILKSPARKRAKEGIYHDPSSHPTRNGPISSLSYTSAQSKQKSIFTSGLQQQSSAPAANQPKGSSSSSSLSRSPAKTGLKGIANLSAYFEEDKENAPTSTTNLSRSTSSHRAFAEPQNNNIGSNTLNQSSGTPKRKALVASTGTPTARSPGIRSPLQSSTSKARQQQATGNASSNLSASAPASPLRSPGIGTQSKYQQSPLTRSQRLTQTTSSANASPSTTSNAPPSSVASKIQRPVSPSPTPRPATRTLRSPTNALSQTSPRQTQQGRLLSPLSLASDKVGTPRSPSGDHKLASKVATSANTTPVRVVDDVFTLPSTASVVAEEDPEVQQAGDGENSKESEDMDDDEEEIENILLGYTKTPAVEPGKKVIKSDMVKNATSTSVVVPVVEVPIREKELPAIPQVSQPVKPASSSTKASIRAAITRISPPRPTKSPARPLASAVSVGNNKDTQGRGIIANISPSKITRPIQNFRNNHNHSLVKRDMSHLASIASMLSPSKPAQEEEQRQDSKHQSEGQSRPASPQLRHQSRVPVPHSSATGSPSRPRSPVPGTTTASKIATGVNSKPASPDNRPTSPSRISSRIAALAGAAKGNTAASASTTTSRESSPRIGSHAASPSRFGITRSPRLKQALRMDSPASPAGVVQQASSSAAPASGLPTPTKAKRPMLSPIQSPNSQRSLALSSLRKAIPGFETNSFSPPASPRLPSTTSISSNIHHVMPVSNSTLDDAAKAMQIQKQLEEVEKEVQMQLTKDEDLIEQHARAISALGKSLPPPPSPSRTAAAHAESGKKSKPTGLSPPAKSPLRKLNSKATLADTTSPAHKAQDNAQEDRPKSILPTPSKDANETVMPQTVMKKAEPDATVQSTAHKDSIVDVPPSSPVFSSFLANNASKKRTSTLSFAGLPGRALGATGREKSIGLGLGLGKSLGASSMKDRQIASNQTEDADSQGSTQAHNRQSFYTAALASQSRKRLSSTLGSTVNLNGLGINSDNTDAAGNKASRTEFNNTARASILASQMQRDQSAQSMSHSARFDLLRSRISNIKGSTGYAPPSASLRTSFATSTQAPINAHHAPSSVAPTKPEASARVDKPEPTISEKTQAPPLAPNTQPLPTSTTGKETPTLPTSTTSTFASTIASFVPAPAFATSFASIFGAGAIKSTKPDSPLKAQALERESDYQNTQRQVQSLLYPSLPSMGNLNLPLAAFSSPERIVRKPCAEPEDEELIEELASNAIPKEAEENVAQSSAPSSPVHQKKRSSSVLSIVSDIEAKEAAARRERERQASLSPRKASGAMPAPIQVIPARSLAPRSTTPTFSPPKQDALARLSTGLSSGQTASRPESRLSDMPTLPGSEVVSPDLSIAGVVDIEDPGLDAIPRTLSDDAEIPTTDAASGAEDEEMPEADDEGDEPEFTRTRVDSNDASVKRTMVLQQSAPAPKVLKPAVAQASNLSKSTFKPSRPGKEASEIQRPVHRPPSRAPSVSSLAPSRASTVSLASTSNYNPSRPGTAMSTTSKKGNLSVASTSAGARPEIKSLANAAAAAKKEQAEKERKAAIKEERDQKRAAFLAAKREEQNPRNQHSSQGLANGPEKKRKDRDDLNASQIASSQTSTNGKMKTVVKSTKTNVTHTKTDDDQTKKRKMDAVEVVVHKAAVSKTTVARPPQQKASATTQSSNYAKQTIASSSTSSNAKALAASSAFIGVTQQAQFAGPSRPSQQASSSTATLQPSKSTQPQALLSQHQQAILSASAAFGKSQASSSKATAPQAQREPEVPEPDPFQLPEIDSEYSDSDEDVQAQKAALRPVWTHSPELRQALAVQAMFDPDQLFGEMPALKMEEIFKNPATIARLRHRTSSAHWSGPDAISKYEEREYAKRMGFKKIEESDSNKDGSSSGSGSAKR